MTTDDGGLDLDSGDLVGDLSRWLADARVDAAVASRARASWLRQQLEDEATLAGVLLDLAERGRPVSIHSRGDRRLRGTVRAVAEDFCALRTSDSADLLVVYTAILAVRPTGDAAVVSGGRPAALDMTMVDALAALLPDRPRVLVGHPDGSGTAGELRSVGRDVLVLRPDGEARAIYVPLTAVATVIVEP